MMPLVRILGIFLVAMGLALLLVAVMGRIANPKPPNGSDEGTGMNDRRDEFAPMAAATYAAFYKAIQRPAAAVGTTALCLGVVLLLIELARGA